MSETKEVWAVVLGAYEKWRHPSNHNDKHYRVILRSTHGHRKVSKVKHKTASAALEYAQQYNQYCMTRLQREALRKEKEKTTQE